MKIFRQRFSILLFLLWFGATTGLFMLTVWGDFDTLVSNFEELVSSKQRPENVTEGMSGTVSKTADRDRSMSSAIRKQIVRDTILVEEKIEKIIMEVEPDTEQTSLIQKAAPKTYARGEQGAGTLTNLECTQSSNLLAAHLSITGTIGKISKFRLGNPARLVVDLHGKWKTTAPARKDLTAAFVRRVDVGIHPDKLRLVFRFQNPRASTDTLPQLTFTERGLNIEVQNPAGQ